jgi:hypothetical protein
MGPRCCVMTHRNSPLGVHILACPSYEPVASKVPEGFQSRVVTSLLSFKFGKWLSTMGSGTSLPSAGTCHKRAVASPELFANTFNFVDAVDH